MMTVLVLVMVWRREVDDGEEEGDCEVSASRCW